jgi:hypothetical protein
MCISNVTNHAIARAVAANTGSPTTQSSGREDRSASAPKAGSPQTREPQSSPSNAGTLLPDGSRVAGTRVNADGSTTTISSVLDKFDVEFGHLGNDVRIHTLPNGDVQLIHGSTLNRTGEASTPGGTFDTSGFRIRKAGEGGINQMTGLPLGQSAPTTTGSVPSGRTVSTLSGITSLQQANSGAEIVAPTRTPSAVTSRAVQTTVSQFLRAPSPDAPRFDNLEFLL